MSIEIQTIFLKEITTLEMGQSPDSSFVSDEKIGIPFLQGCGEFGAIIPNHIFYCKKPKKVCKVGDVLISVRAPVGALNKADRLYCIGRGLAAIRFNPGTSSSYGWHLLNYRANDLKCVAQGSTFEAIGKTDLENLSVAILPTQEQVIIAEILDTIDEAIARTESLIVKLKQIKAGLLSDLLTRGIDENGELRDPDEHPEQFKDSPLGRIPSDWEVFKLLELVPSAEYGISESLEDDGGIPVLRMNNLRDGEVSLTDLKKSASPKALMLLLKPYDVLFNRTNSIEHVGKTAIWRGQIKQASFPSYLVRLVPDKSKLIPEYLNIWLNLPFTQLLIRRYATPGVHQVNINPTNLRKVFIALSQNTFEQEKIVKILDAHDTRIQKEQAYLNKLKQQKKGLMQDLLTGKVRVKI